MRCLHVLVLCTLAAATSHAETLAGRWCGIGEQTNPGAEKSYWSANLLLAGREGYMEYPSLDCGGTLTFERSENNVHFYRERITYGRERCLDDGLVAVEQVGASVRWEWTGVDPNANVAVTAAATLSPNCAERPGSARLDTRHRRPVGSPA